MISHLRRTQGDKGAEDGQKITMQMLRGSHSIVQLSDLVICLQRDISSGSDECELVTLKNRFNGRTGPCGTLKYDADTGRLLEHIPSFDTPSQETYSDF